MYLPYMTSTVNEAMLAFVNSMRNATDTELDAALAGAQSIARNSPWAANLEPAQAISTAISAELARRCWKTVEIPDETEG